MAGLVIWTLDWVPEGPRGFVRDLRLRRACEEARQREWLAAGRFTVADLLMADVLRVPRVREFGDRPATEAFVARVTARPAFEKAHADQVAHFATGDARRSAPRQ